MNKNVFISYGHGKYDEIVSQLAKDIRAVGFNAFFDKDYLHVGDWEKIIDNHIIASKYFLFMVSERSTSNEGYCLNELCRAGESNSIIIPILLDNSTIPLGINKYQRLSLMDCLNPDLTIIESKYMDFLKTLYGIISGNIELGFSTDELRLKSILKPISSREYTFKYYDTFCGRKQVFKEFEKFINGPKSFFWINAGPGTGKTALSSMLVWKYPDNIGAVHFCKFNNSDRVNPKNIITSLAYQLSNVIPSYKKKLVDMLQMDDIFEKNATRIFEYLLVEATRDIVVEKPIVIIIDALDECSWRGNNEICSLLQRMRDNIPDWMKFVLTSRNESEIRRTIYPIAITYTLSESETQDDLREFYQKQFPSASSSKIEALLAKSEGSFLYASEITKQIKNDNLSLDDINFFPVGIYGFFNDCFSRLFGNENENIVYDDAKPILEFLCIAQEPTNIDFLEDYLDMDEYKLKSILGKMSGLFPIKNQCIEPLHKSLIDWLTDSDDISQIFFISKKSAYKKLLAYIEKEFAKKNYSNIYVMKYYDHTLISLQKYDELANILNNQEFQNIIIDKLEFDSGLEKYLRGLSILSENAHDKCIELLNQKTFIDIFSENRRLLYNSGMFFILKDIGLSIALRQSDEFWGIEGEIGKVFYYYIVEDFNRAIRKAKALLTGNEDIKNDYILSSELYNVKGLSERKLVRFDDAIESFDNSIECAEIALDTDRKNSDIEFELSLAYLIKSKIYTHMLEFNNANKNCKKAVKILSKKIQEMPTGDKRVSNTLFLAEDYRVFADSYIWQKEYDLAEDMLKKCEAIYIECKSVDRYFIRYKYTTLFLKIMRKDYFGVLEELKELLTKEAKSKYDKGILNFYIALCILRQYGDDSSMYDEGITYAREGADIFDNIDALLEKAQCNLVLEILCKKANKTCVIDSDDDDDIDNWIEYVKDYLQE